MLPTNRSGLGHELRDDFRILLGDIELLARIFSEVIEQWRRVQSAFRADLI